MKTIRGNKGFTLIELLAVIVVLSIVSVLAARSVLPYMGNAGKEGFVIEANEAISAASDAMSLINIGSITDTTKYTTGEEKVGEITYNTYCFTLANLKDLGLFKKDDPNYKGIVKVRVNEKSYTYTVEMTNSKFKVNKSGQVTTDDIKDKADTKVTVSETCS